MDTNNENPTGTIVRRAVLVVRKVVREDVDLASSESRDSNRHLAASFAADLDLPKEASLQRVILFL